MKNHYRSPIFERVIDAVKLDNISPAERRVLKDEESWEDTLIDENHRGRQEERITIARALISEGISTEVIARTTGIPEIDIEKLRQ